MRSTPYPDESSSRPGRSLELTEEARAVLAAALSRLLDGELRTGAEALEVARRAAYALYDAPPTEGQPDWRTWIGYLLISRPSTLRTNEKSPGASNGSP